MYQYARIRVSAFAATLIIGFANAQVLTVQVGSPPSPPTPLVTHSEMWALHKGTNAPQADWLTVPDGSLTTDWAARPGGFGYGDNGITNIPGTTYESTMLPDMRNLYTTIFIRRSFTVGAGIDTNRHLLLTVDYDDGFVAYLDGVEIRRANTTNAVGSTITHTQTTGGNNHEASCCNTPNPATTYDLGAVSNRLAAGTHVFALVGLNDSVGSSDLHLVANLSLGAGQGANTVVNNGVYALTSSNTVVLTGSNTIAGASRVSVNGDDASFNPAQGTWANTLVLAPGLNRLSIAALDFSGNLLSNLTQDIVYEPTAITVGGSLAGNTFWTNTSEVIHVTSTVTVPASTTLTIGAGVVVIVSPGASIRAAAGGTIDIQGQDTREVFFLPATSDVWNEIAADGANSFLTIRHAEINRGAVKWRNGATGLMEDSYAHDYKNGSVPIAGCTSALSVTVRRSHFRTYHETLWGNTLVTIEDSLFEFADNPSSDALDYDGAVVGSSIRRTTFRNGPQTNTDAIDIGPFAGTIGSTNTIIESCLMHDFPNDKGVSIGEGCYGIVVRNCVIYRTESGIGVKDSPGGRPPCTAIIYGNTITDSEFGIRCYNKSNPASPSEGGQVTNSYNNILFGNLTNVALLNGGTMVAEFSDIGGGFPGTGNIDADPLWVNAAARDFHLQAGSPALGTGAGGTNMGVTLPVGGIPLWVFDLAAISTGTNDVVLRWRETADNEDGFIVQRSINQSVWQNIGSTGAGVTNFIDTTGLLGQKYYYRVRATNDVGVSPFSNLASGQRQPPIIYVGGTISANVTWGSGVTVIVTSAVTVAASATVTIQPGVEVLFNQGTNFIVNGLLIAEGTEQNRIVFKPHPSRPTWGTLDLFGTGTHRLRYVDIVDSTGNIDATSTAIYFQSIWWTNTLGNNLSQLLDMVGTSVTLLDSYIPGGAGIEPVHFSNMPANGYALIKGNVFGAPAGYNDSLDFTGGNRPGPIIQFIDNVFLAAVDDCMDLDATDAHIEGNIFLNVRQDATRDSTANAIATGEGSGASEIVVVRNIFYNCDHAMLLKDMGSAVFENNTVVTIQTNQFSRTVAAYVQFGEPHRNVPGGRGILMNGNILWDLHSTTPFIVFTNGTMFMVANNNIIQGTNMMFGGNSTNDPMFVNWQTGITHLNIKSNLALLAGSPAIGTGPNGLDRGALVPGGASISGEPIGTTTSPSATLTVAGPGIYAYRWKLNNGPWSNEVPLTNNILITATLFSNAVPITLSGLTNGTYTVSVIGKNSAGFWQDTNSPTISKSWTVALPPDIDADGMPDAWEQQYGLIVGTNDSAADEDGDGMTNLEEYLAGTIPNSVTSRLAMTITPPAAGTFTLQFNAVSNKSYSLLSRPSLATGDWVHVQSFPAATTNRAIALTNLLAEPTRFYEVTTP